ncbi:15526_t:CDS:2 [Acaulospora morrowiae]|uniref:15526_t:CDS:1 n=1 Tax=Acaulospora morrowiae TaxID=94023 RepID=A0A9N9B535_9GLOM|nr:15526_t:CDS:2 [Acaulospora morrowiae]
MTKNNEKSRNKTSFFKGLRKIFCFRPHYEHYEYNEDLTSRVNDIETFLRNQQTEIGTIKEILGEIRETIKGTDVSYNINSASTSKSNAQDTNKDQLTCQRCHSNKFDNEWCSSCDPQYFIDHFSDWTSGNSKIDSFIQTTQRKATSKFNFLEWIPYESLSDVKYLGQGSVGTIYSATWIDGPRSKWMRETNEWGRYPNVGVALKSIELKDNESSDLIFKELQSLLTVNDNVLGRINTLRTFGITKNPEEPEKYMMVILLANDGDLGHYIKKYFSKLTYFKKLEVLFDMITGILQTHRVDLVHRDLHRGNILCQRFIKLDEGRDELWLQKLMFATRTGISQEFLAADEKRLVELPVEELSPGARYHSKTYHTVNRRGFSPITVEPTGEN